MESKILKLSEAESGMVVTRGGENGEMARVSVMQDEQVRKPTERSRTGRQKRRRATEGAAGGATYFVFPSVQAIDTQPGMKPGSRVNQRPTSRKKQSRTLISAKERGPSFLYSAHSTSWADFSSLFFSRLQPQDRLEEAKMTGRGERVG